MGVIDRPSAQSAWFAIVHDEMQSLNFQPAFNITHEYQPLHGKQSDNDLSSDHLLDEPEALGQLIRGNQVTALSRVHVQDPQIAARLCAELALDHPTSVLALLGHDEVYDAVDRLFKTHDGLQQHQQEPLIALLLDSGKVPLHAPTSALRQKRRKSSEEHWEQKKSRHQGFSWSPPETPTLDFKIEQPYPYQNAHENSLLNRNGKIRDAWCRHITREVIAAFEKGSASFKRCLREVAEGTYPFNTQELERTYHQQILDGRDRRIQFTPEYFGRILVWLLSHMKPQERKGYMVGWSVSRSPGAEGHEMCVLLEKQKDGMNKVWWYDPNLSGNAMHFKAFAEDLINRSLDFFDILGSVEASADVFSIDTRNQALAEPKAGQFIRKNNLARMASLAEALANGTVQEVAAALNAIDDWRGFEGMRSAMRHGLTLAVLWGHAPAIRCFAQWLGAQKAATEDDDTHTDTGTPPDLAPWTRSLNDESLFDLLTRVENPTARADTALAYLALLAGASRDMDKASRRELYKILHAFQDGSSCCYERLSWGYQLLSRDPGFRAAYEQLMAQLKFW